MEAMSDEELCAFVRKKVQQGQRPPFRGGASKRERIAPPRDKRDVTCANCLKKGHTSQECKAPKVAAKDRKCFECGEAGHVASKCPNKDKARVLADLEQQGEPKPVWFGCVMDSQEVPVHRKRMTPMQKAIVAPPAPRGCTLGDCMGSVFLRMAEIEKAEDEAKHVVTSAAEEREEAARQEREWEAMKNGSDEVRAELQRRKKAAEFRPEPRMARSPTAETSNAPGGRADERRCPVEEFCCSCERISICARPQVCAECGTQGAMSDVDDEALSRAAATKLARSPDVAEITAKLEMPRPCRDAACRACPQAATRGPIDLQKKMAERRKQIRDSKELPSTSNALQPSWRQDIPTVPERLCNFWGVEAVEELNTLPEEEPEFLEIEMTLDTGATVHAADRLDFPGCNVLESPGSKAGQHFQTAGNKLIPNEGQASLQLTAPGGIDLAMTMQIAKITRPLLSVTKMTESGEISVLCKKDVALVLDSRGQTVATFNRKGGLYVCLMKYRNPRYKPEGFARPHE